MLHCGPTWAVPSSVCRSKATLRIHARPSCYGHHQPVMLVSTNSMGHQQLLAQGSGDIDEGGRCLWRWTGQASVQGLHKEGKPLMREATVMPCARIVLARGNTSRQKASHLFAGCASMPVHIIQEEEERRESSHSCTRTGMVVPTWSERFQLHSRNRGCVWWESSGLTCRLDAPTTRQPRPGVWGLQVWMRPRTGPHAAHGRLLTAACTRHPAGTRHTPSLRGRRAPSTHHRTTHRRQGRRSSPG